MVGIVPNILSIKQIFIDCSLLLLVGFLIFFIRSLKLVFRRGFFCNDEDLLHPFVATTIEDDHLTAYLFFVYTAAIIVNEIQISRQTRDSSTLPKSYRICANFAFGLVCLSLTDTCLKSIFGRLRPCFLTVCAPSIDCSLPENQHVYHTNFSCTKNLDEPDLLFKLRLSFPSGHTSTSMYVALFFAVYVQKRVFFRSSILMKSAFQFVAILICLVTSLWRISDYLHHWTDIAGGFVLGTCFAIWTSSKIRRLQVKSTIIPMNHVKK